MFGPPSFVVRGCPLVSSIPGPHLLDALVVTTEMFPDVALGAQLSLVESHCCSPVDKTVSPLRRLCKKGGPNPSWGSEPRSVQCGFFLRNTFLTSLRGHPLASHSFPFRAVSFSLCAMPPSTELPRVGTTPSLTALSMGPVPRRQVSQKSHAGGDCGGDCRLIVSSGQAEGRGVPGTAGSSVSANVGWWRTWHWGTNRLELA